MTPAFTVILPHRRNPGNDRSLAVCLDCLFTNTVNDFKLIIDAATDQPLYPRINAMITQTDTEIVVYMASDVFQSPAWDVPMLEMWDRDTIVNGVVVEPGVIGVYHESLTADFGRTPEQFASKRAQFEAWVTDAHFPDGLGWYCPYMISRSVFLEMGGFQHSYSTDGQGFSDADMVFFDNWKASGKRVVRARSYAYHLQRYSSIEEQEHPKRNLQT